MEAGLYRRRSSTEADRCPRNPLRYSQPFPAKERRTTMRYRSRETIDLAALAGIALILLALFLYPFVVHGLRFPLGPDAPVYLWWMRAAGASGLSVVPGRPGAPALLLTVSGTLHLSAVTTTAALQTALGIALGISSAALAAVATDDRQAGVPRATWALAGLLAGVFAVHLVAGYLANLAFAAAFVAACVALAAGSRRGAVAAALLLAGGGLSHPQFFLFGAGVIALVAAWDLLRRDDRAEAARLGAVIVAAIAVVGAGLASMLGGPPHLATDTSRDAFLRRAGLGGSLKHLYVDRFIHRWTRYVQWLSLPLAILGMRPASGLAARLLRAWVLAMVIGVPIGLATGWFPGERLIAFGFAVPIVAAFGLVRIHALLARGRRGLATALVALLVLIMAAGAVIAWRRQQPFMTTLEVQRASTAAEIAARTSAPGDPIVVIVNDTDSTATFLATRAANIVRAAVPPDRVRDVFIYVGTTANELAGRPTVTGNTEHDALSRLYLEDIRAEGGHATVFVLAPFDRAEIAAGTPAGFRRAARGVFTTAPRGSTMHAAPWTPLAPSSPAAITLGSLAVLALLIIAGYGWARAMSDPRAANASSWISLATAPAFGAAALTLAAIVLERAGVPFSGALGPSLASLLAGGGGYLVVLIAERRPTTRPAPEVGE
jgi:hypothetical protein